MWSFEGDRVHSSYSTPVCTAQSAFFVMVVKNSAILMAQHGLPGSATGGSSLNSVVQSSNPLINALAIKVT